MKLCFRHLMPFIVLLAYFFSSTLQAQDLSAHNYSGSPKWLQVSYDFNLGNSSVDLNGPAFGVSWLMQNKFINTFDFAVSSPNSFADIVGQSNRDIRMRYQIMYMPDLGFGKFRPSIGLGMDKALTGEMEWGLTANAGLRYPIFENYFVELLIPYRVYQNNFQMFQHSSRKYPESTMTTQRGENIITKKQSAIRIGLGVSF